MRRLTGLDAGFLYMETPNNHMHVASTAIFDPSTVPGGYSFEGVRELVENRLPLLPPFRWRLVEVPFGLHHPLWIEDPDFDLDYHLRRAALPSPGTEKELAEFAAEVMSRQLDRRHPLSAAKAVRRTAEMAVNLRARNRQPNVIPPPAPFSAPRTSLNTAITPHRRFAFAQVGLDEVKEVKNVLGGTVNDVVLAMCSGALRKYFDAKGEELEGSLVGMVP